MAKSYPTAPLVSCHALIRKGDKILLVRRARPPFQGAWSLPGGSLELGERLIEGLSREVFEETGLTVAVTRHLGLAESIERDEDGRVKYHYVMLYYEATPLSGEARPGDDAGAIRWLTVDQILQEQVTDSVLRSLGWAGLIEEAKGS
jgi:8-oxo-dGTP diphosphatase